MGLFSRRSKQPEFLGGVGEFLLQGQDMILRTGEAHATEWGLGSAERWELDPTQGVLRWTFVGETAEAPAQIIGTYSPAGGTWMWGWANPSLPPALLSASEQVRTWGVETGQTLATQPKLDVSPEQAEELMAIAFRITGATGYYRAPSGSSYVYLIFGAVTITSHDGTSRKFNISVD